MSPKYDWVNAANATVPHGLVYKVDENRPEGDDVQAYAVAAFYFHEGEDPEKRAIELAEQLNAEHGIHIKL